MSNFTTELIAALSSGQDVTEFFRNEIETAINSILEHELTSFLDYEKWDPIGYNSGNSRNGFYGRSLKTKYGMLNLRIPRDRSGEFTQQTAHQANDKAVWEAYGKAWDISSEEDCWHI